MLTTMQISLHEIDFNRDLFLVSFIHPSRLPFFIKSFVELKKGK
jgi:hypothetical protein